MNGKNQAGNEDDVTLNVEGNDDAGAGTTGDEGNDNAGTGDGEGNDAGTGDGEGGDGAAAAAGVEGAGEGNDDDGEVSIIIDGDAPPDDAPETPQWVRDLRRENRELAKQNRELQAKAVAPADKPKLRDKPTLKDHEFDDAAYEADLDKWHEERRAADEAERAAIAAQTAEQQEWLRRVENHKTLRTKLKVKDYEDAEAAVLAGLSDLQRNIIIHGAGNSAMLEYAIGKNSGRLKELAAIKDPVKFAWAAAQLETKLKVTPRKAPPAPPSRPEGSGPVSGNTSAHLDRMRADGMKKGDISDVMAFKRQKRMAERAAAQGNSADPPHRRK